MNGLIDIGRVREWKAAELSSLRGLSAPAQILAMPARDSWHRREVALRKLAALHRLDEPEWEPPTLPLFESGLPGLAKEAEEALDGFGSD